MVTLRVTFTLIETESVYVAVTETDIDGENCSES